MIKLKLLDDLTIQILTDDIGYLTTFKDYLTDYVENFRFMSKYKCGNWDGKVSMFNMANKSFPFGLLFEYLIFHKKYYKHLEYEMDNNIKYLFSGIDIEPSYDLNISPRPYQIDCIEACLNYKSGIILSCTASGKSLIIAYIIKTLMDYKKIKKTLIIVPTISLTTQFKSDLIEYGFDENIIGRVFSKVHEFDKEIVISTWQTLIKTYGSDILDKFDCVIADECHTGQSLSVRTILSKCINANWRFGFTGTMPLSKLDKWNVQAYLGPILKTYGAAELAEMGYVSECKIEYININYKNLEKYNGDYNDVKEIIFNNTFRMNILKNIISKTDNNVLVMVGKVEKEGKILKEYLEKQLPNKEVVFIYGDTKADDREFWRSELGKRNNIILIATYQIFQVGVNVPSLKYILFASPFKSKIRVLQSIGRALRKHKDKDYAVIYDIVDNVPFLEEHGSRRLKYYLNEKFDVNESNYNEL